jgi:hypothetical protein
VEQSGQDNLRKLESMKDEAFLGGGKKRIDAQHSKGKLTRKGSMPSTARASLLRASVYFCCLMMIHLRSSTC